MTGPEPGTDAGHAQDSSGVRAGSQDRQAAGDPLPRVIFAALVLACFAAFFITQRLKHTPTAVQAFFLAGRFAPHSSGGEGQEPISFKLDRAEDITVAIIDTSGNTVATLVRDHPVARYKQFSLRWNGREGSATGYVITRSPHGRAILVPRNRGAIAPPGEYRVRVSLLHQNHPPVLSSRSFTLEAR